ncbi:DUF4956 domain-containing protein [Maridesulfovibrio frigidus]|uniref:DUF4956 domain-containing protein n=1 Tax=Maridesulfovibrio frigidus TaxID=340956 RepID=UPI0004E0BF7E|nr:DUF4956 domain-containing protein [Maridesulfovibrio frigidus]
MNQLNFSDVFKKSFVAMQSGMERFTAIEIVMNLGVSFLIGLFIFYVYKKTFQGVLYQRSFNIGLVILSMVVTLIIMTISGNLVLSLGMVGALSIVRFRTPIKDPIDLVFIFWAITVGIANGVGYFNITIIGSIAITIILLIMTRKVEQDQPFLLVMQIPSLKDSDTAVGLVKKSVERYKLKSTTVTPNYTEVTAEVRLKSENTEFLTQLHDDGSVLKATLISYSGDLSQV